MKAFQEAAKSRMPCATCGTTLVDDYADSPSAYPELDYGSSPDSLTAALVATVVHSVSTLAIASELWYSRMLTYLVSIALDHGPTASTSQSSFPVSAYLLMGFSFADRQFFSS
jgi:hypothetical protein